ncbi:MarR family transcriptional regulator [Sphingobium limneticum]|uniref:ArsR family transcriptional regulator n=1 Tax=Sphingobium limneticum TaxID=1007511 RepID=A0A5J5HWV4_9SPHN|nr:MarR family transcriptional regulator [Sphingobium limneticum]KAA9013276.1 ArsR family transcriptional regulator [Sphingobium limneticum]KAA9025582.1 ArsR family transcriptional regulator [Sphingobium limneticum]
MTAHIPPDRHLPSQEAVDLVVALQRCLTNFHARKEEPAILDGEGNDQLPALARYLEARRVRAMLFGQNLFADPAWDILLALYQAELEGVALTLEQLSETLRLSLSVVVGQVGTMERRGLLDEHRTSPNSRRRRAIRLSPLAMDAMASWFSLAFEE